MFLFSTASIPFRLLFNRERRFFLREYSDREREVDYSPNLVPRSRTVELYIHSPTYLHGMA
jgi:hypothetical protein